MANPVQGGLNQVSQQKPPAQNAGKFDTSAVQAENLEEISKSKPTGLKEKIVDDLGDQRDAMNAALVRMRESLDLRKNRMFDPVLMQTAAGFLKPTKTGSFGESLGYAAEGAGVAAERELIRDAENQKLEMELLGKEQEFRQQLTGDQIMSAYLGGPKTGAPPPAGGAGVPQTDAPIDLNTQSGQQQVIAGVRSGRIPVTDELIAVASRGAPKLLPFLQEMRRSQNEEEKNQIARENLQFQIRSEKRKTVPQGLRTEREMDAGEYAQYKAALKQFDIDNDMDKLGDFYQRMGWLEQEQVGKRRPPPKPADGTSPAVETSQVDKKPLTDGKLPAVVTPTTNEIPVVGGTSPVGSASTVGGTSTVSQVGSSQVPRAKTQSQLDEDKARRELEIAIEKKQRESEIEVKATGLSETQKGRAKAAEEKATRLGTQAEAAFENTNIAKDMIGYSKNNPAVFELMNKPGLGNAIARAVEQGASVGNFNVSLPASVVLQYKLEGNDLTALQMFMQKSAQLQSRGRQLNRTPGEGAISDYETKLLGGIYALPSDSQRAIILKSDALMLQGKFDEERFKLWVDKRDQPGMTYDKFLVDEDYKNLKSSYRKTLDRVREENMDLLAPKRKQDANKPVAETKPVIEAKPKSEPPKNETYSQKLERLAKEREAKGQ
jgi:hypothetical protein